MVTVGWQAAYDAASGQVLLFGGDPGFSRRPQNLTWEWTGTNWTLLSPAKSPLRREYGSMTYDALNQRIVLFGGASNGTQTKESSSTRLWNGSTWQGGGWSRPTAGPVLAGAGSGPGRRAGVQQCQRHLLDGEQRRYVERHPLAAGHDGLDPAHGGLRRGRLRQFAQVRLAAGVA
jgi:hypothetical protein